jgi:hypothetical protein
MAAPIERLHWSEDKADARLKRTAHRRPTQARWRSRGPGCNTRSPGSKRRRRARIAVVERSPARQPPQSSVLPCTNKEYHTPPCSPGDLAKGELRA